MKIKQTIFGSGSEERLFTAIQSTWSKQFDLYPSLPFSCIVEEPKSFLNANELNFFYKTSIDYTLCAKSGQPMLCIEFDGLGKGFNRNGEYVEVEKSRDPYRKLKLDLKLRIAEKLNYPLFVVSYEETRDLEPDINLTIVDGIIGQSLARREFTKLIKEAAHVHREFINQLPLDAKAAYTQDMATSAEVTAELKWDPIAKLAAQYEFEAFEKGIATSYREEFLDDLPQIVGNIFTNAEALKARVQALKNAKRVGCRVIINLPKLVIIEAVWIRNFEGAVSPLTIASNIAHLTAFKRALKYVEKQAYK